MALVVVAVLFTIANISLSGVLGSCSLNDLHRTPYAILIARHIFFCAALNLDALQSCAQLPSHY